MTDRPTNKGARTATHGRAPNPQETKPPMSIANSTRTRGPHPTDSSARLAAHDITHSQLILDYEDITLNTSQPLEQRYNRLQTLACQAIARLEQLDDRQPFPRNAVRGALAHTLAEEVQHEPVHLTRPGAGNEEGQTLHAYDCACGEYRAAVYMHSRDRALQIYMRNHGLAR